MVSTHFSKINLVSSLLLIVFFIQDIAHDLLIEKELNIHSYVETVIVILLTVLFVYQIKEFKSLSYKLELSEKNVEKLKQELSVVIKEQFQSWGFTNAEKEVAWLILKGFSYNDISIIRKVSEKTINQQAGNIFKKSSAKNRHEFISGFIEDLL